MILSFFNLDCKPDPCHGRGVCSNTLSGFLCNCQQGFTGVSCELGESEILFQHLKTFQALFIWQVKKYSGMSNLSNINLSLGEWVSFKSQYFVTINS